MFNKIDNYLYSSHYISLDYAWAKEYFESKAPSFNLGGCSSVRKGNWYGRNLDWFYTQDTDFLVRTENDGVHFASIGISSVSKLTANIIDNNIDGYEDQIKAVPYMMQDGINQYGVFANINVVHNDYDSPSHSTPLIEERDKIATVMLVRYILDNFTTALEACEYIKNYVTVYNLTSLINMGEEAHFMIGDENETYVLEFIDGTAVYKLSNIMTNFYINPTTFNEDGTVLTPLDVQNDPTRLPSVINNLSDYAMGCERFDLIVNNYDNLVDKESMVDMMHQLDYRRMYRTASDIYGRGPSDPLWITEITADYGTYQITCDTPANDPNVLHVLSVMDGYYTNRDRDAETPNIWITTHSSIYDIESRKLYVFSGNLDGVEHSYEFALEDISKYTNPRYINSSNSEFYTIGTLNTPTNFRRINNILDWSAVEFAQFYEIYDNNNFVTRVVNTQYVMPVQTIGDHTYKVRAFRSEGDTIYQSEFTDNIEFTVVKLNTPELNEVSGKSCYYWDSIDDADYYDIYINGVLYETVTSVYDIDNSYNIKMNSQGTYNIKVSARNNDSFLYLTSDDSNILTYNVYKLSTPIVEFDTDTKTLTWEAVSNANAYKLYLNNEFVSNVTTTSYQFDVPAGAYSAYIKAIKYNQDEYANPLYLDSNNSNIKEFGLLATPVITITDNVVSWAPIDNAASYEVYDYDNFVISINDTSYTIESSVPAAFNIRVKAISNNPDELLNSNFSNTITYYITKLSAPNIVFINTNTINISPVINADVYDIYINNSLRYTVSDTLFNMDLYAGYNNVYVIARSNLYKYLDSNKSNTIISNINPDTETIIKVFDKTVNDYIDYPLIYPLSFNETIDETLDIAKCITAAINVKDPFEAYSNASIYIYSGGTPVFGFPKHMLISEDDVEEIQIGDGQLYKHNITLIERTKQLESDLMPDFSITQPLDYVLWNNTSDSDKYKLQSDTGSSEFIWTDERTLVETFQLSAAQVLNVRNIQEFREKYNIPLATYLLMNPVSMWNMLTETKFVFDVYVTGTHSNIIGDIDRVYNVNSVKQIYLPVEGSLGFNTVITISKIISDKKWYEWIIAQISYVAAYPILKHLLTGSSDTFNSYNDMDVRLTRRYYYRQHSSEFKPDNEVLIPITVTTDNTQPIWDISTIPNGNYDIVMEIDPVDTNDLYALPINADGTIRRYSGELDSINLMKDKITGDLTPYRVIFGNNEEYGIQITRTGSILDQHLSEPEHQTLENVFDRVLNMVNPLTYKSGKLDSRKYELDENIRTLSRNINCPELTFTGTKSLYEVLQTLGRLFYGVPRLGLYGESTPSNTITYDIINFDRLGIANKLFIDNNTKEEITSTINNHTTGYVSDLKNVTNTNYWNVYPSGDMYTTARASSYDSSTVTIQSMCVEVDKPIYKLVDVWITNYNRNNPDADPISLKNVIFEKTLFNALNNNRQGKGQALYYQQGDTRIMGFGQLPEQSQLYAILDFSSDEYVIENILKNVYGINQYDLNTPHNYKYKVFYIPCNDMKIYTEQANISGLSNDTYKVLNQDDNVIDDSNFGKSAQTQVERLGNNNIIKTYRFENYLDIPFLGQVKEYDGNKYFADNITIAYFNNYIDAQVSYSKNFNKINERVGVDSLYRLYEIENKNIVNRTININNYCYVSTSKYLDLPYKTISNTNYKIVSDIKNSFNNGNGFSNPEVKPDSFYIRSFKNTSPRQRLTYLDYQGNEQVVPACIIPASYNTFKTNIAINGKFYDNFSAGAKANEEALSKAWYEKLIDKVLENADLPAYFDEKSYFAQKDVRYCDTKGNNDIIGITIASPMKDELEDLHSIAGYRDISRTFPEVKYVNTPKLLNGTIHSEQYLINKDNKECLNITYQLHFQTFDKNIYLHSGITSRLYKNMSPDSDLNVLYNSPYYVLYKGDLNRNDKIINMSDFAYTPEFTIDTDNRNIIKISGTQFQGDGDFDGVALIWNDGTIIYTINQHIEKGKHIILPDIYLNFGDEKSTFKLN